MKAVERVKALLQLAQSPNPNEAAAALQAARRIMAKHRLSDGDLAEQPDGAFEVTFVNQGRIEPWQRDLACTLAILHGCVFFRNRRKKPLKDVYLLAGPRDEASAVLAMKEFLVLQFRRWARRDMTRASAADRRAYYEGMTRTVCTALESRSRDATGDAEESLAIVLWRSQHEKVLEWLAKQFGATEKGVRVRRVNAIAYNMGKARGEHVDLMDPKLHRGRTRPQGE